MTGNGTAAGGTVAVARVPPAVAEAAGSERKRVGALGETLPPVGVVLRALVSVVTLEGIEPKTLFLRNGGMRRWSSVRRKLPQRGSVR